VKATGEELAAAVALMSVTLGAARGEEYESVVASSVDAIAELHTSEPTLAAVRAFSGIVQLLVNELALVTGETREDVWRATALQLARENA
jgi:hypothetical protein